MQDFLMNTVIVTNNIVGLFISIRFYNYFLIKRDMNHKIIKMSIVGILFTAIIGNIVFEKLSTSLIVGFAVFFTVAYLFYLGKVHIKLIVSTFVVIFSLVSELLTALLFTIVFRAELQNVRENLMLLFIGSIISKIILIILVEFIIRFRRSNASKVSLSSWILIISIPVISIVLTITSVYEPILKNEPSSVSVFSCLSILYINIIALYLFDNIVMQADENNQYRLREKLMLMQQEQYENIIVGYNQVKRVRHDILSHLITLHGYLTQNQCSEAIGYIQKLNEELDFNMRDIISNNTVIDAIINNRKAKALDEGIEFKNEIIILKKLKIEDIDLSIVLGNVLNNAIEACLRLPEGHAGKAIAIKMNYKQ